MLVCFLQEGGELYFSDVYVDRDLPDDVRKHKVLWGKSSLAIFISLASGAYS